MPASSAPARRESPLLDVFIGPEGIYPGTRWLIYLALAFVVFQVEGWLLVSLRSHLGVLEWRMTVEASMMLAAILPGFAMARIEQRPFGDFGLPPRRAFRRNFWIGTLWGIVSLSILMVVLRFAGVFAFGSLALHAVGALARNEFLAHGGAFVVHVRRDSRLQSRRSENGPGGGRLHRLFSLSHAAADGRFVVGRRLPHGVGLGRELSLLRSRQRIDSPRPPAQLQLARSRVANGRLGWPGGKLPRLRRHRRALGLVCPGLSGGEVQRALTVVFGNACYLAKSGRFR